MPITNPYARQWSDFLTNSAGHILEVLHDDGVYRHLRMSNHGSTIWSWDIVTWPGYLSITGDIADGWTFHRCHDMFDFFDTSGYVTYHDDGAPYINPDYWAEKLAHEQRGSWDRYSPEVFLGVVGTELKDTVSDGYITREAASEYLDQARSHSESEVDAYTWASDNPAVIGHDFQEISLREPKNKFLFGLYAITTTVQKYRELN